MTSRTAMSIISSARLQRYASNLGPAINNWLPSVALNEGTFLFVHEAIVPVEFLHGLRLRLKQPSRWRVWNIIIQHALDFATNKAIMKNLAMLLHVTHKIVEKTL